MWKARGWMHRYAMGGAVIGIMAACATDNGAISPSTPGVVIQPRGHQTNVGSPDVVIRYPGKSVYFEDYGVAAAAGSSTVLEAAAPWLGYFHTTSFGFGEGGDVTISILWHDGNGPTGTPSGSMWVCGKHDGATNIVIDTGTHCAAGDRTTWANIGALLTHEIGHSLGFNSDLDGLYTNRCIMNPNGGSYNTTPCDHEEQWIAVADHNRSAYPANGGYLVDSIAVHSEPSGLMVGDNATLHVLFHVDRDGDEPYDGDWQSPSQNGGLTWSAFGTHDTVEAIVSSGTIAGTVRLDSNGTTYPLHESTSFPYSLTASAVPTPTNLDTTHLDTTSASVAWTNGASHSGMYTVVQLRLHPSGAWSTTDSVLASSQVTATFTGLADSTAYDVQVRHVNGDSAGHSWATKTFTTHHQSAGGSGDTLPALTSFSVTACDTVSHSGHLYNRFTVEWALSGTVPTGWVYQIGGYSANSDSSAASSVQSGGSTVRTDVLGDFRADVPPADPYYFWIRYHRASPDSTTSWFPLADNALAIVDDSRCTGIQLLAAHSPIANPAALSGWRDSPLDQPLFHRVAWAVLR